MRYRRALLVIGLVVGLAGCDSTTASPQETFPASPNPREQLLEDAGLRDVRMTSGAELRWVQPETASQILCQLLDKDAWEELLGSRVGRRTYTGPTATCHVNFSQGLVSVELSQSDDAIERDLTIAGRPAELDPNGYYRVALTDEALEPAPRNYYGERRLLTVTVHADDEDTEGGIAEKVIEELVPPILAESGPVPAADDEGYLRYEKTPVTGDFVDLPTPVQALQLCTVMREELGAREVEPREDGDCRVHTEDETFSVAARHGNDDYPDEVAGRPALVSDEDTSWVEVRLRDDAGTSLWVSSDNAVELAEKLVPLLTA